MARLYTNNYSTTLNGAILSSATSMTLTDVTAFPAVGGSDYAMVTITDGTNVEIVKATAIAGSVVTIVRAQDGTTAVGFADTDTVGIRETKESFEDVLAADTSPVLRGPLDVNSNAVVSSSAGDIAITPDTTGNVILDGLKWPQADGTAGYVLKTDGLSQLSWVANGAGGGLANIVEDLTPQLGGELELNGNYIDFGISSSATAYCLTSSGGTPRLVGAANYYYTFTSSSLDMQAGTSFYKIQMHNSNGFTCTTNSVVRIQANNSGVQFGAAGARINTVKDEDTMVSNSATDLATQQSIKAYVDSSVINLPYDIAFNAGFNSVSVKENVVVQTYAELVMSRAGSVVGEAGYIDTVATGAAATGAAVIVDIEKNGITIYSTKPQFAVSTATLTAGTLKVDGTKDFVSGDRITFKVTQIGSTIAGQGVRFTIKTEV